MAAVIHGAPMADLYALAEDLITDLLPTLPEQSDSDGMARAMARMLARSVAGHTPRPDHRFVLLNPPLPGRNDPCDCGSGRKYKHCCLSLEHGAPGDPIAHMNLLPYVLDRLPRRRWGELVGSAINPLAVDHTARAMLEDGDGDLAIALLEPWFKDSSGLTGKYEPLLDTLLDAFTALDRPRKKKQLLERALARGDCVIRSGMHQHLATMAADNGDYDSAWRHFREAQREHADAASLSHLEIILLTSQGEHEQARERDLPPVFRASVNLVESVILDEDGHEEALHRRADHWFSEAGSRRYADQRAVSQARLQ